MSEKLRRQKRVQVPDYGLRHRAPSTERRRRHGAAQHRGHLLLPPTGAHDQLAAVSSSRRLVYRALRLRVVAQAGLVAVALAAALAHERLPVAVRALVTLQLEARAKPLAAAAAAERLPVGVRALVHVQRGRRLEALAARVADEELRVAAAAAAAVRGGHVLAELPGAPEQRRAVRAPELVRGQKLPLLLLLLLLLLCLVVAAVRVGAVFGELLPRLEALVARGARERPGGRCRDGRVRDLVPVELHLGGEGLVTGGAGEDDRR